MARGGNLITEVILYAKEGEEAHKEMGKGKPGGKCTRLGYKGYTARVRGSYVAYKNKGGEVYKWVKVNAQEVEV